jgi:hypothetical protein
MLIPLAAALKSKVGLALRRVSERAIIGKYYPLP